MTMNEQVNSDLFSYTSERKDEVDSLLICEYTTKELKLLNLIKRNNKITHNKQSVNIIEVKNLPIYFFLCFLIIITETIYKYGKDLYSSKQIIGVNNFSAYFKDLEPITKVRFDNF